MAMSYNVSTTGPGKVMITQRHANAARHMIMAICATLLIVGTLCFLWWQHYIHKQHSTSTHTSQATKSDNKAYASLNTITTNLSLEGQYLQAANLWITYASKTANRAHEGAAYVNAGALYLNTGQYSEALMMCKKAETANGITYNEAQEAAEAARDMGDKLEAIYYYQKAIQLMPNSLSSPQTQKYIYNLDIKELQGSS